MLKGNFPVLVAKMCCASPTLLSVLKVIENKSRFGHVAELIGKMGISSVNGYDLRLKDDVQYMTQKDRIVLMAITS